MENLVALVSLCSLYMLYYHAVSHKSLQASRIHTIFKQRSDKISVFPCCGLNVMTQRMYLPLNTQNLYILPGLGKILGQM